MAPRALKQGDGGGWQGRPLQGRGLGHGAGLTLSPRRLGADKVAHGASLPIANISVISRVAGFSEHKQGMCS